MTKSHDPISLKSFKKFNVPDYQVGTRVNRDMGTKSYFIFGTLEPAMPEAPDTPPDLPVS